MKCEICGRSFKEDRIEKHVQICEKASQRKVKKFDSAANRLGELADEQSKLGFNGVDVIKKAHKLGAETEKAKEEAKAKDAVAAPVKESNTADTTKAVPAWKKKSLEFRAAMLASKAAQGGEEEKRKAAEVEAQLQAVQAAAPPDPNKVTCPHCGRSFNKESAEKHINICLKMFGGKPGGGRLERGGGKSCMNAAAASGAAPSTSAPRRGRAGAPPRPGGAGEGGPAAAQAGGPRSSSAHLPGGVQPGRSAVVAGAAPPPYPQAAAAGVGVRRSAQTGARQPSPPPRR